MSNIGLVIQREFMSRVRKKSFMIMTILGPVLFAAIIFIPGWLAMKGGDEKAIVILDPGGNFEGIFSSEDKTDFLYNSINDLEEAKASIISGQYDGLLYIPDLDIDHIDQVTYYASGNPSLSLVGSLRHKVKLEIENQKLRRSGLDQSVLDQLKANVEVNSINLTDSGEKESSSIGASIVGYISGFLIYMFIFIYGAMCMRGVIEEKSSRIIEVMVASVRPFDLMMGKVLGIASVGLAQFLLWVILTSGIAIAGGMLFGVPVDSGGMPPVTTQNPALEEITSIAGAINIPLVLFAFVFYFIGGYLFYGALFAAVGSAVDSDADAQQFMLPVSMPLIFSIVMLTVVLNDSNGTLATWLSMIPFTAPVVMMVRVTFGIPVWELILSMLLMIGGFVFMIWVAGRIYRVGILMYGTKVNYKVLAKWFMTNQ